jgi:hypothetical protein
MEPTMKRVLVATLALLTGCGNFPIAELYVPPSGQSVPANPPGVPASTPFYVIKRSSGANVPLGAYGITTNETTWFLEWQGDGVAHRFSGDVYAPVGSSLAYISLDNTETIQTGTLQIPSLNHFHFDDPTGATEHHHLQFDATMQRVLFDLKIDGQPAINPATTFPSGTALCTIDHMPFGLVTSQ